MDVELYIYDLSKGLARVIDAIYHTSLVFGGVEYFYGQGIQRTVPGTTHHGEPMEKLHMGRTELPIEVIQEYLESLAQVYTPESYDLFLHNCNNFTQDLAMFLVGKGIPEHIRSLPETFLSTPFGQMMKPQIDQALCGITQGGAVGQDVPAPAGRAAPPAAQTAQAQGTVSKPVKGYVRNVSNLRELEEQLALASNSCAVIFFTSSTCAPCKMVYPTYDELAEEAGDKAVLIKVDLNFAFDVGAKYGVRATPTFMTFLKGKKENEWSGANPAQLKGNVRMLIQMAFPPHPHSGLRLPSLQRKISSYVTYTKTPPLDKLLHKIGDYGADPTIQSVVDFVKKRNLAAPAEAPIPNLSSLAAYLQSTYPEMPIDIRFAVVDLVRVAFLDARVSGFFAEEPGHKTLLTLFSHSTDLAACPYNLRIVMLQLACNLFTTPLYPEQIASNQSLRETCIRLLTGCLLDSHTNLRVVAASFAYNLAAYNHNERFEGRPDKLSEGDQVELVASLLEAIGTEQESIEALHGCLFALGLFLYEAPLDGEVVDLCRAMGAADTVKGKSQVEALKSEPLLKEIGQELLEKGLK
ncbi:Thioredoxin [Rasamsonia emersonii CBS 393.64]|uniref:Thioredoxin n=1 Tax=Rasamsonia emersonii (strain ATCC 16479 / CBS 393.64 / IMI 116815) TaxID=1408163 RepID=A0A0F4YK01_RASE3|nr:Thioredoxin [Rasamsonia emersonii CBS 393.64]KKA18450.1 Thioredoxin [Rasamsonia emersonii CBS 393.64]